MTDHLTAAHIMPGMIESHFHSIEMREKGLDPAAILTRCFKRGMVWAVDASVSPEDFGRRRALAAAFPNILLTAGIYPSEAKRFKAAGGLSSELFALFESQLDDERLAAVGEIGLDGFHDYASLADQQELFRTQLALAESKNLPVVIHNRDCDGPVLDALRSVNLNRGGMMHCFSSSYAAAKQFLDLGFLISFAGNLTFKSSHELQDVAKRVPGESFLVETDSPFLAPVPRRGRPNHPGNIGHIYEFLAQLRSRSIEELVETVQGNFERLFIKGKNGRLLETD
jgi:TatD DNase family protein